MVLFWNWFKSPFGPARRLPLDARDYHAFRCAQELAMARKARSAVAAEAHARLAMAHRQAADGPTGSTAIDYPQAALRQRPAALTHFEGPDAG